MHRVPFRMARIDAPAKLHEYPPRLVNAMGKPDDLGIIVAGLTWRARAAFGWQQSTHTAPGLTGRVSARMARRTSLTRQEILSNPRLNFPGSVVL